MIPLIIDHVWQSSLFAAAAWTVALALQSNRASVRYAVWFVASTKFLIPFAALIWIGSLAPRPVLEAPRESPTIQAEWISAALQIGAPLTSRVEPVTSVPARHNTLLPAALIWGLGFSVIAALWIVRWRRVARLRRTAAPVPGIAIGIPVMSARGVFGPAVWGFSRPVLLLPEGFAQRLDPAQLEAIIAHELCHVRRRDNFTAAIHMVVQAIFWFHPLVWWLGAKLIEERERACDEFVVRSGNLPRVYAEGILNVCKICLESPLACVAGVTGADLKRRIQRIVANQRTAGLSFAKRIGLALAAAGALLGPVVVGLMHAPLSRAQAFPARPADTPRFEVASIKSCVPEANQRIGGGETSPGRLSTGCIGLVHEDNLGLIQRAYVRLGEGRSARGFRRIIPIVGGPAWLRSELFSIVATPEGSPSEAMMNGPMLQLLLEDRFKLKLHREMREGPIYALTSGGALKFSEFKEGSCVPVGTSPLAAPPLPPGQRVCRQLIRGGTPLGVDAEGSTLEEFANMLSLLLDRPVVNRTDLAGRFDLHLSFSPDQATPRAMPGGDLTRPPAGPPSAASDPTGLPSVFTAIQEQLGLKLVGARGPTDVLVIDHVERPSEN